MGMYAAETMLGLIIVVAEIGGIDFAVCHEIVARIQRSEVGAGLGEFLNRINSVNPVRRSPGLQFQSIWIRQTPQRSALRTITQIRA